MFHSVGIVKCREMLEEGRWVLWDLNPGRKAWCWECSSDAERVIRHVKQSQCPRVVASKNRRAQTVRAQQEREQNVRQELQQASEEPKPEDSDGEGDVQHSDQDSDDDDFFASQTAKYLVWLGQVVSEADNHYALYVMQIVSRSKNTVNAFALHCSKPATRKDCIGSVMFNIVTPITSLFVQGKIHSDKQNSRNTQEGRGCNFLFRTRETRQTPRKIENADQEFTRLSVPSIRSFDKNFANNNGCSLLNEGVLLLLNCF